LPGLPPLLDLSTDIPSYVARFVSSP
jgi:hypothetical protein